MKGFSPSVRLSALLICLSATGAFAQTEFVADPTLLETDDYLDLATLGTPVARLTASIPDATSNNNLNITIDKPLVGTNDFFLIAQGGAYWPGNFVDGEPILVTNEGLDQAVPIEFGDFGGQGVCKFGIEIQPELYGSFEVEIEGYDANGDSLLPGGHLETGTSAYDPTSTSAFFAGIKSSEPMHYVQVRVISVDGETIVSDLGSVAVNSPVFSTDCEPDEPPEPENIQVDVDIRPLTSYNLVNTCSKLAVPVALLSTEEYDVLNPVDGVDPETLMLADAPVATIGWFNKYPLCGDIDANGDGMKDLVCLFQQDHIDSLETSDTEASVTALSWDEQVVEGSDSVKVVHQCPRWSWPW